MPHKFIPCFDSRNIVTVLQSYLTRKTAYSDFRVSLDESRTNDTTQEDNIQKSCYNIKQLLIHNDCLKRGGSIVYNSQSKQSRAPCP
jgi:hypothetical protein